MTRELAMVHAREGIRFNALCPWVEALFSSGEILIAAARSERPCSWTS
jgi:NAD(P)-dependent dehydrogenase (short-subunit alcohol dehydrogenase family)